MTIKFLGVRKNLRGAFVLELRDEIAEFGWTLCELESGGYGAIQTKTLEAAKTVTAKRWLTDEERKQLRRGQIDFDAFEKEALPEEDEASDDED